MNNNLNGIEILDFDKDDYRINFIYNGDKESNLVVWISWGSFTIYRANMFLTPNPSVIYFIGSKELQNKNIDKIDVNFLIDDKKYSVNYTIRPTIIEPHSLSTLYEDTSYYSYKEIFIDKIYENNEVEINKNDIVVDIGANLGFFSVYAKEKEPSKIYCFEPSKELYDCLKTNVGSDDNVVFQKAISGEDGKNNFLYYDISSASGRLCNNEEGGYEVETIGINSLINFLGVDKINYLKIDCEGCEKNIFENITKETISKIDKMVIEYHSEEIKELIIRKLNEFGVEITKIENQLIFAKHKKQNNLPKKKIVLISSFCDNQKKMDILRENIIKLKSLNLDTMVIVPNFLPVDEEIIKLSDFVFYTKENPLLKYPVRQYTHWYEKQIPDGRVTTLHRGFADYGWAALYQTKKLSQIALTFDYDLFYHLIYDVEIDDVLLSELRSDECNIIHPRRNPNHPDEIWECTLHFMVFDRDMMSKIEKEITLEEYMSTNGVAEGEVLKWKNKFNLKTSEHCIKDKIFYWENFDFFNMSPFPEFKMFLSKNPELEIWLGYENPYPQMLSKNLRIVFHEIPDKFKILIIINGIYHTLEPKNWEYVEFPIDSQSINEIIFVYEGRHYDYTKEYSEIMLNQVFYNFRN
jgi:FkbM family methyltransferase